MAARAAPKRYWASRTGEVIPYRKAGGKPGPIEGHPKNRNPACRVYFMRAATLGLIKIGRAEDIWSRWRKMRTFCPDTLMMLGAITPDDAGRLERELHKRFAEHRSHGEWFHPAPELLAYIEEHASLP